MSDMNENGGAKTLSAKTRGAVTEAIGGLFSDMFSEQNNHSEPKQVEEQHGFAHTASRAAGQGIGMMSQVSQRMSMMQFMRQQGTGVPRRDSSADFAATVGMDMDGDGIPDF